MAYENIQLENHNFTVSRDGGSFFSFDHVDGKIVEKNSSGAVVFSYFLDTAVLEVYSLEFDGVHFWTLERQGSSGFRVRKWAIGSDNLVRVVSEFSYASDTVTPYDVYSMAVEFYSDTLSGDALVGGSSVDVAGGSVVRAGDDITIGPSTAVGFEGEYFTVSVSGKTGNTLNLAENLSVSFSPNDPVYFTRNFFVFSDSAVSGLKGALYKYKASNGALQTLQVSNMYNLVRAATFFKEHVMFVRGGEVVWLDPVTQAINKSQAIRNLDETRSNFLDVYDLAGFSNTLYRLEDKHVSYDEGEGSWETEDWSPRFNYNTSNILPEVYFVSLKADPPLLHRSVSGLSPGDGTSEIFVQVLDQFRTPVFNKVVDFSSTGGPLSSSQETTDADGIARTTYTSDSLVGEVTITATVS